MAEEEPKDWNEWSENDCRPWWAKDNRGDWDVYICFSSDDSDELKRLNADLRELKNERGALSGDALRERYFPSISKEGLGNAGNFNVCLIDDVVAKRAFEIRAEQSAQPEPTLLAAITKKYYPSVDIQYYSEPKYPEDCEKPAWVYAGEDFANYDDLWHIKIDMVDYGHDDEVNEYLTCEVADMDELTKIIAEDEYLPSTFPQKEGMTMWEACNSYNDDLYDFDEMAVSDWNRIYAFKWVERKLEDSPFINGKPLKDFDFETMKNVSDNGSDWSK